MEQFIFVEWDESICGLVCRLDLSVVQPHWHSLYGSLSTFNKRWTCVGYVYLKYIILKEQEPPGKRRAPVCMHRQCKESPCVFIKASFGINVINTDKWSLKQAGLMLSFAAIINLTSRRWMRNTGILRLFRLTIPRSYTQRFSLNVRIWPHSVFPFSKALMWKLNTCDSIH